MNTVLDLLKTVSWPVAAMAIAKSFRLCVYNAIVAWKRVPKEEK